MRRATAVGGRLPADGNYRWYGNVHLCTFSITAASYGPRGSPRGRGRPRRAGGRAGWPRSARTRRCRPAGDVQSRLLGTAAAGVHPASGGSLYDGYRLVPGSSRPAGVVTRSRGLARGARELDSTSIVRPSACRGHAAGRPAEAMSPMEGGGRGVKLRPPRLTSDITLLGPTRLSEHRLAPLGRSKK